MTDEDFKTRMIEHMARLEEKVKDIPDLTRAINESNRTLERHEQLINHNTEKLSNHAGVMKIVAGYVFTITIAVVGWLVEHKPL